MNDHPNHYTMTYGEGQIVAKDYFVRPTTDEGWDALCAEADSEAKANATPEELAIWDNIIAAANLFS